VPDRATRIIAEAPSNFVRARIVPPKQAGV
jgi:hypothetical protein